METNRLCCLAFFFFFSSHFVLLPSCRPDTKDFRAEIKCRRRQVPLNMIVSEANYYRKSEIVH